MHVRCKRTKYTEIHRLYEKYKHGIKALQFRKKKKKKPHQKHGMLQVIRYTKRPVPALTRKEREEKKKQTGKDYQEHRIKQTDETCESSFLRHANQHPFFLLLFYVCQYKIR